jgi:hypothetical protein
MELCGKSMPGRHDKPPAMLAEFCSSDLVRTIVVPRTKRRGG